MSRNTVRQYTQYNICVEYSIFIIWEGRTNDDINLLERQCRWRWRNILGGVTKLLTELFIQLCLGCVVVGRGEIYTEASFQISLEGATTAHPPLILRNSRQKLSYMSKNSTCSANEMLFVTCSSY